MKSRIRIPLLAAALFLLTASLVTAQDFKIMTAEQLKSTLDREEKILVVDTRTSQEYKEGHIPTAINIPPPFASIQGRLPENLNTPIVFYCRGYT